MNESVTLQKYSIFVFYLTQTMENNFKMVAKTLFGFEELLAGELRNLGAQDVKIGVRNVCICAKIWTYRTTFKER